MCRGLSYSTLSGGYSYRVQDERLEFGIHTQPLQQVLAYIEGYPHVIQNSDVHNGSTRAHELAYFGEYLGYLTGSLCNQVSFLDVRFNFGTAPLARSTKQRQRLCPRVPHRSWPYHTGLWRLSP